MVDGLPTGLGHRVGLIVSRCSAAISPLRSNSVVAQWKAPAIGVAQIISGLSETQTGAPRPTGRTGARPSFGRDHSLSETRHEPGCFALGLFLMSRTQLCAKVNVPRAG